MAANASAPTDSTNRIVYQPQGFGPILRFLTGLFLIIGILVGLAILSFPLVAAYFGPGIIRSVQTQVMTGVGQGLSSSDLGGLLGPNTGFGSSSEAQKRGFNDAPINVLNCIESQLTKDQLEQLKNSNTPSADELKLLGNCGFDIQAAQNFSQSQPQNK